MDANEVEPHTLIEHLFDWGGCVTRLDIARQVLNDVETRLGIEKNHGSWERVSSYAGVWEFGNNYSLLTRIFVALTGEENSCALIGADDFGWEYAAKQGLDLARCVQVPSSAADARVISLLLPYYRVLYLGKCPLEIGDMRRLSAQVRQERAALFTAVPWGGMSRLWCDQMYERRKAV